MERKKHHSSGEHFASQQPHQGRVNLEARVAEIEAEQRLGELMADRVRQQMQDEGKIDVNMLLGAELRMERAGNDAAWLGVLMGMDLKPRVILAIWEAKDKILRKQEGGE